MKALLTCLVVCVLAGAGAAAPTTDRATENALEQIDQVKAKQNPRRADQPALPRPDRSESGRWRQLWRVARNFWPVLLVGSAVAIAGAIAGTFVLLRREALAALAMPQIVAVGAAIGLRYNWPTLPPALLAAAVGLWYLVYSHRRGRGVGVLPALYVAGLSISFLVIANKGQDVTDLQKLFTGIDVAVAPADAAVATPWLLGSAALVALLWRRWLLMAQAPAAAELAGLHPARWDALFLTLLMLIVLFGTNAVGVVMVLAMLFIPAAAALPWSSSVPSAMLLASIFALLFMALGFIFSNELNWPLSQTIGGVGFAGMFLSRLISRKQ